MLKTLNFWSIIHKIQWIPLSLLILYWKNFITERFTDFNWWILPVATWVWNSVKVIFTWTSRWSFFSGNAKKRFRITLFTLKNEKKYVISFWQSYRISDKIMEVWNSTLWKEFKKKGFRITLLALRKKILS